MELPEHQQKNLIQNWNNEQHDTAKKKKSPHIPFEPKREPAD